MAQFALCLAVVLSLTNGALLVSQIFGWAAMARERAPELGLAEAIAASIDGSRLCDVCLAVQSEAGKQRAAAPDSAPLQAPILIAAVADQPARLAPPPSRPELSRSPLEPAAAPDGRPREVATPPPRFEAQA